MVVRRLWCGKNFTAIDIYWGSFYEDFLVFGIGDSLGLRVIVENRQFSLILSDKRKQEKYSHEGIINYYLDRDIFLILFSIVSPESLNNIISKWHPKVRRKCPNASIVVIGTKLDLRDNQDEVERLARQSLKPVTYEQDLKSQSNWRCILFMNVLLLLEKGFRVYSMKQ